MRNLYRGGLWYQVNCYDGKYYFNWATNRGIAKGQYGKMAGIQLEENILEKAIEIGRAIDEEEKKLLSLMNIDEKGEFDTIKYEHDTFDKRFRELLTK